MSDNAFYKLLENFDNIESSASKLKKVAEVMQEYDMDDMPDGQAGERIHARVEARKEEEAVAEAEGGAMHGERSMETR